MELSLDKSNIFHKFYKIYFPKIDYDSFDPLGNKNRKMAFTGYSAVRPNVTITVKLSVTVKVK